MGLIEWDHHGLVQYDSEDNRLCVIDGKIYAIGHTVVFRGDLKKQDYMGYIKLNDGLEIDSTVASLLPRFRSPGHAEQAAGEIRIPPDPEDSEEVKQLRAMIGQERLVESRSLLGRKIWLKEIFVDYLVTLANSGALPDPRDKELVLGGRFRWITEEVFKYNPVPVARIHQRDK
jgi:hypothetical protein